MAIKHNITVSLDRALLKRLRAIAAGRGLSVSGLLADKLRVVTADDTAYGSARRSALAMLKDGLPLRGARITDRESVHERSRMR